MKVEMSQDGGRPTTLSNQMGNGSNVFKQSGIDIEAGKISLSFIKARETLPAVNT